MVHIKDMPKKLLLADDSITVQKVVAISFAEENFEIHNADNDELALSQAKQWHPDIVIADVDLPNTSGYELCERLRNDETLKSIPVLLLLPPGETFDSRRGKRAGIDDYIVKPFETSAFVSKVKALIDRPDGELGEALAGVTQPSSTLWQVGPADQPDDAMTSVEELDTPAPSTDTQPQPMAGPSESPGVSMTMSEPMPSELSLSGSQDQAATIETIVRRITGHPEVSALLGRHSREVVSELCREIVAEICIRTVEEMIADLKQDDQSWR